MSSSAVLAFVEDAAKADLGLHSLMLLRHGQVVSEGWWEPYGARHPHMLFSLSKSFVATAAGLAVAEGLISLDDPVSCFFPDALPPEVGPNLAAMRVRHLLLMSTGHGTDTIGVLRSGPGGDWVQAFLAQPVAYVPGTHFLYNSGATYLISAIVQKATGDTLLEFLRPRLFQPLGIQGPTWESSPQGINTGGWGLSITTEDIARFGQFSLQRGVWQGRRLLSEEWVAEATGKQIENGTDPENDWAQGYGFQFWRCRHGAYRGDGAFGQFCVVMPDQDAVVAMTAGSGDLGGILNLVWKHLLPAMGQGALQDDPPTQERLRDRLRRLSLPAPEGSRSSPLALSVSGRVYVFTSDNRQTENNELIESILWDFHKDGTLLTLHDRWGEHRVKAGTDMWEYGKTGLGAWEAHRLIAIEPCEERSYAARGAWSAPDTYIMQVCFYETPFILSLTARFSEDRVTFGIRQNVSFGPTEQGPLNGRA